MRWRPLWTEWLTGVSQALQGPKPVQRSCSRSSAWLTKRQLSPSVASTQRYKHFGFCDWHSLTAKCKSEHTLLGCNVFIFPPPLSQDDIVDLRQVYLSVAALSGFVSFKSLLHTAFTVSPIHMPCCILPKSCHSCLNFVLFCSCLTRKEVAALVQRSCEASWGRCWASLSTTPLSCILCVAITGCFLKVSASCHTCRLKYYWEAQEPVPLSNTAGKSTCPPVSSVCSNIHQPLLKSIVTEG